MKITLELNRKSPIFVFTHYINFYTRKLLAYFPIEDLELQVKFNKFKNLCESKISISYC